MTTCGLDLLGRRGWKAAVDPQMIASSQLLTELLPTSLLPIRSTERLLTGIRGEQHRRGRGLPWPPESQVPVLANPANGTGRLPLPALFDQLVEAESGPEGWGRLADTGMTWNPDGHKPITVEAQRMIAAAVGSWADNKPHVGLVVPDGLQVAGQQAILDACADVGITPFLVPRTMAAVLAWCRAPGQAPYLSKATSGDGTRLGHIVVIDAGLGAWAISKVPVQAIIRKQKPWLAPIRDQQLIKTDLGVTGWGIVASAAQHAHGARWLNVLADGSWLAEILSGKRPVELDQIRRHRPELSGIAALSCMEGGSGIDAAVASVQQANSSLAATEHSICLGCIVTGATADLRLDNQTLGDIIARKVNASRITLDDQMCAHGAAWAVTGQQQDWPTWREVLIPIGLYYIGKNAVGDDTAAWKELITATTVDAGTEYRNPEPITGLAVPQGSDVIRLTLRRCKPEGEFLYRMVETTKGKATEQDTPVIADVRAVAGQGFAVVTVRSKEEGLFASTLNWHRMQKVQSEPEKPRLSYIPGTVTVIAEKDMYTIAAEHIEIFNKMVEQGSIEDVQEAARKATKFCNRCVQADIYERNRKQKGPNDPYIFYAPVGLNGRTSSVVDDRPLVAAKANVQAWITKNFSRRSITSPVRRLAGWWYRGCPQIVVDMTRHRIRKHEDIDQIDLHVIGRCFTTTEDIASFLRIAPSALCASAAPLNWLRALRNITRLNEDALSNANIRADLARDLVVALIQCLNQAVNKRKKNIACECFETLVYVLKRRRYQANFLITGDSNRVEIEALADHAMNLKFLSNRGLALCEKLMKFLRNEATQDDVDTIISDNSDGDDSDDD